jgi:hypothetical protein
MATSAVSSTPGGTRLLVSYSRAIVPFMPRLIPIDAAAEEYKVHRTTLYRALRERRLTRHRIPGSRLTWLDADEVSRLVSPGRLSEAEVNEIANSAVSSFFEVFASSDHPPLIAPPSLEGGITNRLARFLEHFQLEPSPDFADHCSVAVMYETGPGFTDRPLLAIRGQAGRHGAQRWTFHLALQLTPQLNMLAGPAQGIASPSSWMNEWPTTTPVQ